MATQTVSNVQYALTEAVFPTIQDQLSRSHFMFDEIIEKRGAESIESVGRDLYAYIHNKTGKNWGVGHRAEEGALPTADRVDYDRMYVALKYFYGTIKITGQAHVAGKTKGALVDILTGEIQDVIENGKWIVACNAVGDGSGALGKGVSLDTLTWTLADTANAPGAEMFRVGMVVDSYDARSSGTQGVDSLTITAVDRDTPSITMSAATGISASVADYIYMEDSYGNTPVGLLALIDDGTYTSTLQGLTRTAATYINAHCPDNDGTERDLTFDVVAQACDRISTEGGKPAILYGNHLLRRKWFDLLWPDRRYGGQVVTFKSGQKGMSFTWGDMDSTWVADSVVPKGILFGIDPKQIIRFDATDGPEWITDVYGHKGILHQVEGYDYYQANFRWYYAFGIKQPRKCFRIDDLPTSW